ncbi:MULTISPECIES: ribbon-helix-helix domain-containing protein [unclassified Rhizobium]|uniref:ribbon-helix-helix domain-containing protein n=1 Tax=unclassified Rhizobium TaxID=2613769 RepID=UPI000BE7CA7F|nr:MULTISPECIES: ribbon-helix-helix domain-containing protein [unclassified Rhizobium]MDF0661671.1 ribbon-helix-helix domain-containing protein [Rhizobium sp. BC49]PDS87525.1 aryl-sulfate sulfotransferase [Rhizobium sp. L18]
MCEIFNRADPELYACRTRSVRLSGVVTSIRLENLFWNLLADIAAQGGMSVPHLCTKLYDELIEKRGEADNFASFLRVCCGCYLQLQSPSDATQSPDVHVRNFTENCYSVGMT